VRLSSLLTLQLSIKSKKTQLLMIIGPLNPDNKEESLGTNYQSLHSKS